MLHVRIVSPVALTSQLASWLATARSKPQHPARDLAQAAALTAVTFSG
jgi:hypothetical protein